jgi:hypothetical protein
MRLRRSMRQLVDAGLVRGAHASIKLGAQAPGSKPPTTCEPAKPAKAVTINVNRNGPATARSAGLNTFNDTFRTFAARTRNRRIAGLTPVP